MKLSFLGANVPLNFRSRERKFHRWNFRSRSESSWERKFLLPTSGPGKHVPETTKSWLLLRFVAFVTRCNGTNILRRKPVPVFRRHLLHLFLDSPISTWRQGVRTSGKHSTQYRIKLPSTVKCQRLLMNDFSCIVTVLHFRLCRCNTLCKSNLLSHTVQSKQSHFELAVQFAVPFLWLRVDTWPNVSTHR